MVFPRHYAGNTWCTHMFLGIVVVAVGIVFILKALGLLGASAWTLFWGILFLIVGFKLMAKKGHCIHCDWFHYKHENHKNGK